MTTNKEKLNDEKLSGNNPGKRKVLPPTLPENKDRIEFGKRFNKYRKMKGFSYSEFAKLLRVPKKKVIELCHGVFRDDNLMFQIYRVLYDEYGLNLNWMIFNIMSFQLEAHDLDEIPMIRTYVNAKLSKMRHRICLQISSFNDENPKLVQRIIDSIRNIK